jgi:L-rhamnose mutarotase
MRREAFLIRVRPGYSKEYEKRHNPIWPELYRELKEHGIANYSIYLHNDTGYLFGYYEIEDEELFSKLAVSSVMQRWWRYMAEILECDEGNMEKGREEILHEVFHLD